MDTSRICSITPARGIELGYGLEIERRFFVDGRDSKPWRNVPNLSKITQFYLDIDLFEIGNLQIFYDSIPIVPISKSENILISKENLSSARLRFIDDKIILSLKGKKNYDTAMEFEWELSEKPRGINLDDCPFVEKTRYFWPGTDGLTWEIDEFEGKLAGLVLAEVELHDSTQIVEIPEWAGSEITGLPGWSNSALAKTIESFKQD
ncbi:MAG: hypothetical protein CMA81_00190 [Euryarchaeota archaeon]|nr:hypothetical protein [Euryarchaeota archaeon]